MRSLAIGTTLLCVAAVGCGKNEKSPEGSTATAPVTLSGSVNDHGSKDLGSKDEFELEVDDFYFSPTYVKGTPGSTVKVELDNESNNQHTFTIDSPKVDQVLDAGKNADVNVTLPASGVVVFYCRFHRGQGMQGALYFKAGDTASGGGAPASSSGDGGAYGK